MAFDGFDASCFSKLEELLAPAAGDKIQAEVTFCTQESQKKYSNKIISRFKLLDSRGRLDRAFQPILCELNSKNYLYARDSKLRENFYLN
jgi:hypothetical protein